VENCTYTAHACAPEEERIVGKPPARYPGIRIVAAFFILDGFWISYDIARVWLSGQTLEYPVIYGAIPLFSLIGGIGLWRHRGWGRNFGLASSYILLFRGLPYLLSCYAKHDAGYLVGALTSFLLAVSTGSYLYRKPIRIIFPESPASLSFVGFTLALYAFTQHSERTLVDYLWYVLGLAGVIIGVKAVWLTKNALPLLPEEAPQKAQQIHTGHHGWYIVRHWQGEIALPLAYWGNTVLMTSVLRALQPSRSYSSASGLSWGQHPSGSLLVCGARRRGM